MSGKNATEVQPANVQGIARAATILERGGLVAVPTETVYGLAARADSAEAVAKIYAAKGRPEFNPLIVHVRDAEQAARYVDWVGAAEAIAQDQWPGPLTLVLPVKPDAELTPAVTAGLRTLAVRAPAHPVMRALLEQVKFPLAAPSANRSGYISPTTAKHVLESLEGKVDLVLDGGSCEKGLESTILAVRHDGALEELRPGPVDVEALKLRYDAQPSASAECGGVEAQIEAPGQLASHYAPGKPLRLNVAAPERDEFLIAFGEVIGDCSLSASGDLNEAAARLYDCLHQAAQSQQPRIAVAPIASEGIGRAINDRLQRAAA